MYALTYENIEVTEPKKISWTLNVNPIYRIFSIGTQKILV